MFNYRLLPVPLRGVLLLGKVGDGFRNILVNFVFIFFPKLICHKICTLGPNANHVAVSCFSDPGCVRCSVVRGSAWSNVLPGSFPQSTNEISNHGWEADAPPRKQARTCSAPSTADVFSHRAVWNPFVACIGRKQKQTNREWNHRIWRTKHIIKHSVFTVPALFCAARSGRFSLERTQWNRYRLEFGSFHSHGKFTHQTGNRPANRHKENKKYTTPNHSQNTSFGLKKNCLGSSNGRQGSVHANTSKFSSAIKICTS